MILRGKKKKNTRTTTNPWMFFVILALEFKGVLHAKLSKNVFIVIYQ